MPQLLAAETAVLHQNLCALQVGLPCIARPAEPAQGLSAVDMAQALEDFDGDHASVSGLLRDFLGDRGSCARRLAGLEAGPTRQLIAVLHDVANTLDAGWCRQAALAVRHREERLRRGTGGAAAELVAEVRVIVHHAFEGVAAMVRHCPHCLAHYKA